MTIYKFLKIKIVGFFLIAILIGSYILAHQIYKNKEIASYKKFFKEEEKFALNVLKPLWSEPYPDVNLNQERIKVLIIEGGGIKGVYALRILDYLEKKTGRPISELYDVVGGTSVGSLIVSLLSVPENGKPKFSVEDIITIFPDIIVKVLNPSLARKILSGYSLFTPLVNNQNFIKKLQSFIGNIPISKALNHLVIYGYNFSTTTYTAFHSRGANVKLANPLMYQLLGGTTAYFGIFPPNKILLNPSNPPEFIGDAGIVINNPVQSTLFDLMKMYPNKKFLITYILLNSRYLPSKTDFPFFYGSLKSKKVTPLLQRTAENQLVREFMKSISSIYKWNLLTELGLEQNIAWNNLDSFDFSDQNIAKINEFSKLILHQNKDDLDVIADELMKD